MQESYVHELIINNTNIQRDILSLLDIEYDSEYEFVHEDQYPNSLYADFTVKKDNEVKAIIECKGSDIGVNDFVRGIGQIMQYQHFADNKMSVKGYSFSEKSCAIYFFPSSILRNKNFNIGLFAYPQKSKLIEINEINKNVRLISEDELIRLSKATEDGLVTISQYYVRDNRLFELYLCLRYCSFKKIIGEKSISRKEAEEKFLMKLNTPNNRNWRNAFISLSSLGLIDSNNLPTHIGLMYSNMTYGEFCYEIYSSYIKEYIDLLMNVLIKLNTSGSEKFLASNGTIGQEITNLFNGKKILFVTDSDNRYLSSWLNIM